jgi:GTPase Era involved in 16S rRNA processing
LDILTKEAIKRLLNHKFKPSLLSLMNRLKSIGEENISLEELMKIAKENEAQTKQEEQSSSPSSKTKLSDLDASPHEPRNLSSILVLNKVDLVENKRKLKTLQEELEDLGAFDKVFHVSCETDFGISALKNYLESEALRRPWRYHPDLNSTQTEIEKAEQILKQILYNRFYKEIPYDLIGYVTSWVPMSNGQLKINFNVEVNYDVQISMVVGKDARVIRELREEVDKQLALHFQMPVRANLFVVKRKNLQQEVLNERGIVNI